MQKIDKNINETISSTISSLKEMIDVNVLVGDKIITENGGVIVPFSKVTTCYFVGLGNLNKIKIFSSSSDVPNAGANGAIVTMKPSGFLTYENGKFSLLKVEETEVEKLISTVEKYIEKTGESEK